MSALELLIMMNIREDYGTKIQVAIFHSCLASYIFILFHGVHLLKSDSIFFSYRLLQLKKFKNINQGLMYTLYLQCFPRVNSFINVQELVQQSKFSNLYDTEYSYTTLPFPKMKNAAFDRIWPNAAFFI